MKRIILSIATILVALSANATELGDIKIYGKDIQLGAKFGMNITNVSNIEESKAKVGLTFGITAETELNDKSGVGVELLYSNQGYRYKADDYKFKEHYSYFTIPMLYRYHLLDKITVKAGLQPGFKIAANYREKVDDTWYKGKLIGVKVFDLAMPIGASYFLESYNVVVDVRYNIGLTNIYDTGSLDKHRNSNFAITAQYLF